MSVVRSTTARWSPQVTGGGWVVVFPGGPGVPYSGARSRGTVAPVADITIVHTRRGMLLSKRTYRDWREVQDSFDDYMTSLGPYALDELWDYLESEYPRAAPFDRDEVDSFVADDDTELLWARS